MCGDLNVAHKEIDLKNPKTNMAARASSVSELTTIGAVIVAWPLMPSAMMGGRSGLRQQLDEGACGHGLAGTGLAHHADDQIGRAHV